MVTKQTFDWLRHIEKALVDLDQIPLLGHLPPFDWDLFCRKMGELLQIPDLEIEANNWSWHSQDSIEENLGEEFACVNMAVLPIQGYASLMISKNDLNSLVSWIVEHKKGSNILMSSQFSEGLLNFVVMESLHISQSFPFFNNFMLRILGKIEKPLERSLILEVKLKAFKEELMLRLVVPETFRKQWLQHFAKPLKHFPPHLGKEIDVVCSLEVARLCFSHKEWKKVKVGDFILLKSANIDQENKSGSLNLSLGQKPLFRVSIKNNGLKILEQPVYEEESQSMENDHDDLLSEISDLEKEKKATFDPIPDDSDLDDDSDFEDDKPLNLSSSSHKENKIELKTENSTLEKIEMVPLNVVVELSRFKMTCEKLLQLKPGNLLELDVSLDKPISLVVNGKKIATGELVRIGDSLGVQVTEVG